MKIAKIFILIIALALTGCLGPTKTVKVNLTQTIKVDGEAMEIASKNNKIPTFNQTVSLNGIDFESATDQVKKDTTNAPISLYGGQSNVDSETKGATAEQDSSLKDSANDNSRPSVQPTAKPETANSQDSAKTETVTLGKFKDGGNGGKVFSWLGKEGKDYGAPLKIEIAGCGTYIVPDPTKKWTPDGNLETSGHNQFVFFPGDWPGQDRHGGPVQYASIIAGPECLKETTATITF